MNKYLRNALVALFVCLVAFDFRAEAQQPVAIPYSGAVSVATPTVANSSHASGTSVGGLLTVPLARIAGGGGLLTQVGWTSVGGHSSAMLVRIWQRLPANTTCKDNTAYVGSTADDQYLVVPPLALTPAAPAPTTGDAKTYATVNPFTSSGAGATFKNSDLAATNNLYVCVVTNATDTADQATQPWITLSGILN